MSYLTLNESKYAQPVCRISGGQYDGKIVYFVEKMHVAQALENETPYAPFKYLKLEEASASFTPEYNDTIERNVVCALGRSGVGKSYFCDMFIQSFMKDNNKLVFQISPFDDDPSIKKNDRILKIEVDDETYMKHPLKMTDFPSDGSMLFIDDLDVMEISKSTMKAIESLQTQVLNGGRHQKLSYIRTQHVTSTNDASIRKLISESHLIVLYINTGNYKTILEKYIGLSTKQIAKLRNMPTRWIAISPLMDMLIYTETEIFFRNDL